MYNECPQRCSGRDSNRQRSLKLAEKEEIENVDLSVDLSGEVMKCMYCGCIYRYKVDEPSEVLGWYNGMDKAGWDPAKN